MLELAKLVKVALFGNLEDGARESLVAGRTKARTRAKETSIRLLV